MRPHPGFFITLEGGEGAGKTSQFQALTATLLADGYPLLTTREPGGTRIGTSIRQILLERTNEELSPLAELFLYEASRAQLVDTVIRPALTAGQVVLCDRFCDSTTAYQGYGRGLSRSVIEDLTLVATGGLIPDLTLLLDLPPAVGLHRARTRSGQALDRLESEALAFHERLRAGYLALARLEPERFVVIDAAQPQPAVRQQVEATITKRLAQAGLHPPAQPAGATAGA